MKFLYAVKGCSHCDLRQGCDLKNHKANLQDKLRLVKDRDRKWQVFCKDFFREIRVQLEG